MWLPSHSRYHLDLEEMDHAYLRTPYIANNAQPMYTIHSLHIPDIDYTYHTKPHISQVFPANAGVGKPAHQGVTLLFEADNGSLLSIADAHEVGTLVLHMLNNSLVVQGDSDSHSSCICSCNEDVGQ